MEEMFCFFFLISPAAKMKSEIFSLSSFVFFFFVCFSQIGRIEKTETLDVVFLFLVLFCCCFVDTSYEATGSNSWKKNLSPTETLFDLSPFVPCI